MNNSNHGNVEPNDNQHTTQAIINNKADTDQGKEQVERKFRASKRYKGLCQSSSSTELDEFCRMLSHKQRLKDTFLNTDYTIEKLWRMHHRKQRTTRKNSANKQPQQQQPQHNDENEQQQQQQQHSHSRVSSNHKIMNALQVSDVQGLVSLDDFDVNNNSNHRKNENDGGDDCESEDCNDDDDENDFDTIEGEVTMRQMWLENNPKLEQNLKVKLVITDAPGDTVKYFRSIISPFAEPFMPKFGIFHTALIVGPFKIEWNNSALCIPRQIKSNTALLALDIEEIATVGEFNTTVDVLADVITRWNSSMDYSQNTGTNKHGNCQDFVMDVLRALNISFTPSGPIQAYLKEMKKKGSCKMKFSMTDENFRNHFARKENSITFESHEQLDLFVEACLKIEPKFGKTMFLQEYQLLKAFDRALWMRHLEHISQKMEHKQSSYQPLKRQETIIDLVTCEDGVIDVCACPFRDPRSETLSFLEKSNNNI